MYFIVEYQTEDAITQNRRVYFAEAQGIVHQVFEADFEYTVCGMNEGHVGFERDQPGEAEPEIFWKDPMSDQLLPVRKCADCFRLMTIITENAAKAGGFKSVEAFERQRRKDIENYNKWQSSGYYY